MTRKQKQLTPNEPIGYLFIAPWLIGFLVFTAFPIGYSFYLSFFTVQLTTTGIRTTFIRFDNYLQALTADMDFMNKVMGFSKEVFLAIIFIVVIALVLAILLNQKVKGRGFFRTVFFLPVIISSGPVIQKLQELGIIAIPNIDHFAVYRFAMAYPALGFTSLMVYLLNNMVLLLWLSGVQILIFISALQKVDRTIYEAARMDGASMWEIFWKITLPALYPMIMVNVVYTTVMFSISSLNPIIDHILLNMFKMQTGFGYAAALSWLYFLIILVVLLVTVGVLQLFSRRSR